jgi:hypothetical protein
MQFSPASCYFIHVLTLSSGPFPKASSVYVLPLLWESWVSHLYQNAGKTVFLYTSAYAGLYSRFEAKKFWNEWKKAFPERNLVSIFFMNAILICYHHSKIQYYNFPISLKDLLPVFMLWLCPAFCWWNMQTYLVFSAFIVLLDQLAY